MALPISNIVTVKAQIARTPEPATGVGRTLAMVIGDTVLDSSGEGKAREYRNLQAVGEDFGSTTDAYKIAAAYFAQSPAPNPLLVGDFTKSARTSVLTGGAPNPGASNANLKSSTLKFRFNGRDYSVDTSAATTLAATATALQGAISAQITGTTVTATNNVLVVTVPATTTLSNGFFERHSTDTADTVPDNLGLTAAEGARFRRGGTAETLTAALNAVSAEHNFSYLVLEQTSTMEDSDILLASTWAASQRVVFFAEDNTVGALQPSEQSSLTYRLSKAPSRNTVLSWDSSARYLAARVAGIAAGTDFLGVNSARNLALQELAGATPANITQAQATVLSGKRANFYTQFGSNALYWDGRTTAEGVWGDSVLFLNWIQGAIEDAIFGLLRRSERIPQTPGGIALIKDQIGQVCEIGVRNGGIAPGTLDSTLRDNVRSTTGLTTFSGYLDRGYLVHVDSIADQDASDRNARQSPPFSIWLNGSGAINNVPINLTLEQ